MVLPIVKEPDKILHTKMVPVPKITPEIRRLITDMIQTMHAAEGVGLAANQVGSPLDILVASADGRKGEEWVLINARIIERKGRFRSPEGCLSIPGVSAEVTRSAEVKVRGLDLQGKELTLSASGLMAKILQHETDHLAGLLYVDRLSPWKRGQLLRKYRRLRSSLSRIKL